MNKVLLKQLFIVFFSSILIACVSSEERPDEGVSESRSAGRDCISQSSIRDYQVLDDRNLIVTARAKSKYHIVLSRRAFGLRSSWEVGFRSGAGMFCGNTGEVVFKDGSGVDRIRVASVRQLSPEELDDLLIHFGKKDPEIEQTPATEEVESAEVEELD